jgi:hypothetical protein
MVSQASICKHVSQSNDFPPNEIPMNTLNSMTLVKHIHCLIILWVEFLMRPLGSRSRRYVSGMFVVEYSKLDKGLAFCSPF